MAGTTYTAADDKARKRIMGIVKYYHPHLPAADVTFDILFASNDNGPAVKLHGAACVATIRRNNLAERAAGAADVRLTIDYARWNEMSEKEQAAVIDHEANYLELTDKRDDLDRPVIKLRKDDFILTGFYDVIERHGVNATDGQSVAYVAARMTQMEFDFAGAELLAAKGSPALADGEVLEEAAA